MIRTWLQRVVLAAALLWLLVQMFWQPVTMAILLLR